MHKHIQDYIEPCISCEKTDELHEYMIDRRWSYIRCDRCGLRSTPGPSAHQSVCRWNEMMKEPFLVEI